MMPAIIAVVVTLIIAVPVTYFVTMNMKKKSDDKTTGNAEDRARQIIDGDEPLIESEEEKKPLSIAVDEVFKGEVKILPEETNK